MHILSFHNDSNIKKKYCDRVLRHLKADDVIQGQGWSRGKGCAVGCTLERYEHSRYPIELGLPEWLAWVEDIIFEELPGRSARCFFKNFLKAIPVGVTKKGFDKLKHRLMICWLTRCMKEQEKQFKRTPEKYLNESIKVHRQAIKYHKNPKKSDILIIKGKARKIQYSVPDELVRESMELVLKSLALDVFSALESAALATFDSAEEHKLQAKDILRELKKLK